MRRLCVHTKLNQRYFYESFATADDVLIAALDSIIGELLSAGFAALHDRRRRTLASRTRHSIGIALGVILDDPRKAALLAAVSAGSDRLQNAYRERITQVADAIHSDPEAAEQGIDQPTAIFIAGGFAHIVAAELAGQLNLDRDALADKLTRLALAAAERTT